MEGRFVGYHTRNPNSSHAQHRVSQFVSTKSKSINKSATLSSLDARKRVCWVSELKTTELSLVKDQVSVEIQLPHALKVCFLGCRGDASRFLETNMCF